MKVTAVLDPQVSDIYNGTRTYKLSNGRMLCVKIDDIKRYGVDDVLAGYGVELYRQGGRLVVIQRGIRIGTLPAHFDPDMIKSMSTMYDPRPGDFKRDGDVWVATDRLGPGDLDAVPGFSRELA